MSGTIINKLIRLCALTFCLGVVWNSSATAQNGGTEAATESHLLQIMLPANAQRIPPQDVPAEITQTLARVTEAGGGKFRRGDSEVLAWGGADYRKADAPRIINRLTGSLKTAGWQYAVEGEESGVTVFTALKESPRRAVVGLYGATDDALVFAAMEILPNNENGVVASTGGPEDARTAQPQPGGETFARTSSGGGGAILGEWSNGYSSMVGYRPTVGPPSFTPSKSRVWKYSFHPNGTYEFSGLMQITLAGCTTTYFQDKRGTYTINGNQITLTLTKNLWRKGESCAASANMEREGAHTPENYTLSLGRSENGKEQMCLDSGSGEGSSVCYERAK